MQAPPISGALLLFWGVRFESIWESIVCFYNLNRFAFYCCFFVLEGYLFWLCLG